MSSDVSTNDIGAKVINHLGLVSTTFNNLGIGELIDSVITPDPRNNLTIGDCAKTLTINGLGYTGKPLYLTAEFFKNKPIDKLIKEGVSLNEINDDVLGRALDKLYNEDLTVLFSRIAYRAAHYLNIDVTKVHGDTSSKVIPMMVEAREKASGDELKNLLNPELFEKNFGEDRRSTIQKVIEEKKLHLVRRVDNVEEKEKDIL